MYTRGCRRALCHPDCPVLPHGCRENASANYIGCICLTDWCNGGGGYTTAALPSPLKSERALPVPEAMQFAALDRKIVMLRRQSYWDYSPDYSKRSNASGSRSGPAPRGGHLHVSSSSSSLRSCCNPLSLMLLMLLLP